MFLRLLAGQPLGVSRGSFAVGVVAGLVGTAAMTGAQLVAKRVRGEDLGTPVPEAWSEAPPPAQVVKRAAEAIDQGRRVSLDRVPLLTNLVHWLYGTGWGVAYAVVAGRMRPSTPAGAAALGATAWLASYLELVPLGIQEPPWRYPIGDVSLELSYHLVYGAGVAGAVSLIKPH